MEKAWKTMSKDPPKRAPKTTFYDPMSLMYSLGYKDRRFSLSYDVMRQVSKQLAVISAIINTRIAQVCAFCSPARMMRNSTGLGFEIRHKDPDKKLTASEKRFIIKLENFVLNCGRTNSNKHANDRDGFDAFTKKFIRDMMELDQGCFEIVPSRKGEPFEFIAVDSATIRLAADDQQLGSKNKLATPQRNLADIYPTMGNDRLRLQLMGRRSSAAKEKVTHVQVVRGQIENVYRRGEMGFCVMNPRSSIYANGYGVSNIELLVRIITAHLFAEQYNINAFNQGSIPKGILNIRGENIPPEQMESFRRQWIANVTAVGNAFRTPVMQSEGLDYINLQGTNQEMEYQNWIEYLVRVSCGVWGIDPAEIGFEFTGPAQANPQFDTQAEWKIQKSKDRGLRPLLRFYAQSLSKNIIDRIDDHFYLDFIGLDELSQKERLEQRQQEVSSYKTLNEVRSMEDLPDVEDGDVILNPTYLQFKQMLMNKEQMEQQQQQEQQMQQQQAQQPQQGQEDQPPPPGVQGPAPMGEGAPMELDQLPERELTRSFGNITDMNKAVDKVRSYIEIEFE